MLRAYTQMPRWLLLRSSLRVLGFRVEIWELCRDFSCFGNDLPKGSEIVGAEVACRSIGCRTLHC